MAIVKKVRGFEPRFGENCFLADNAVVVGQVIMGKNCTVWFNAVVRGDVNSITIGDNSNIQDGAVIHGTYERSKTVIAHNAIVHGCTVEDNVLIGMGAIVMDDCVIGAHSIIAAGAVVLPGTEVPSGSIFAGVPAKRVKDVGEEMRSVIVRTAKNYPMYAGWFRENE